MLERNRTPGLGLMAMQLWAARQASELALTEDAARDPGDRRLWTAVSPFAEAPTEAELREQLRRWMIRVHGRLVADDDPGLDGE